jgi:hypothetical protein
MRVPICERKGRNEVEGVRQSSSKSANALLGKGGKSYQSTHTQGRPIDQVPGHMTGFSAQ